MQTFDKVCILQHPFPGPEGYGKPELEYQKTGPQEPLTKTAAEGAIATRLAQGISPNHSVILPEDVAMCICVNCHYVDRCTTYHAVEGQHQQPHLTDTPSFEAIEPTINVNIRHQGDTIEMEWDVVGCESFTAEMGKWSKLRPGELVPT